MYGAETVKCLTNPFAAAGEPPEVGKVEVLTPVGLATAAPGVEYSYVNLWSARTTWGGNNPPLAGEAVVVNIGDYIVLDVSPPLLDLVLVLGTLAFDDSQEPCCLRDPRIRCQMHWRA
jgi:hypothetical protein